ncbi:hypothetical protein NC653_020009 [Populus alba x Populus x berolinensis]|uniref:Uncharacterized protein n=1 Tax=Populus alba x Populus x berolinensis TaxID=444605 RepID=A0AAD6MJS6_9ROSI|nr:hypothetical protein NC653_020009 [Populus alba x Populus x berolinensis]
MKRVTAIPERKTIGISFPSNRIIRAAQKAAVMVAMEMKSVERPMISFKSRMSCHVKILEVQRLACYVPPGTVNAAVDIIFGHECSIEIQSFVRVYPALAAISGCGTWRQYSTSHCNSDMKRRLSIWAGIQEATMLSPLFFSGWQKAGNSDRRCCEGW